ncbi:MAG: carboxypeptidase-like regulatory domain-containing protein, partial [Cytophagales bacterium]|nr:carboxypeptidase-like regulatory domain-containing protein [Cytophagales bacterium]
MPSRPPREHLSHDLIGQYLFGKLPERTRNRVERHLLECDFCSDAVDGYTAQPNPVAAARQLDDLRSRLNKRVNRFRLVLPFGMQPYAVAASVILLITCTLAVWMINFSRPPAPVTPVGQQTPPATGPVPAPAAQLPPAAPAADAPAASPGRADAVGTTLAKEDEAPAPAAQSDSSAATDDAVTGEAQIAAAMLSAKEKRVASVRQPEDARPPDALTEANAPRRAEARGITRVVRGKVTDATSGAPLPGVSIAPKGSDARILSDAHGNFALEIPAGSPTLVFNLVGMTTAEEDVRTANFLRVQLAPDDASLRDVVVVGYGADQKRGLGVTPPGGLDEFNRYVKENLRRPDTVPREAVVKVECVVQADGSLSNFVIRKSAGEVYDREAIRVLKEGPRWQPARQRGKAVPKKVTLHIPFK